MHIIKNIYLVSFQVHKAQKQAVLSLGIQTQVLKPVFENREMINTKFKMLLTWEGGSGVKFGMVIQKVSKV